MRITAINATAPFFPALDDRRIEIGGVVDTLAGWVAEFNAIRSSFNGPDFRPYRLDEITPDDLATEFAFDAYSAWDVETNINV